MTSTLVFEGAGHIGEYTGGYEDWVRQRAVKQVAAPEIPLARPAEPKAAPASKKETKFLKKEQRELDELPARLDQWETEKHDLTARLWEPDLYQKSPELAPKLKEELAALEEKIRAGYARWEELETRRKAGETAG